MASDQQSAPSGSPAYSEPASTDPADTAFAAGLERVLVPEGWDLLQTLPQYVEADALKLGATLRAAGHDPELVSAVLTQSRLRAKGREKFGEFADRMLLTPRGLEQATRLPIAALHARRFLDAGVATIADLGCGIGGDAMAASALGLDVIAVDRDPVTVAVATMNLSAFPGSAAELGDAEAFDLDRVDGVWMDPARRTVRGPARRLHDPEEYSPPLSTVVRIARRLAERADGGAEPTSGFGPVGVKLGPGIEHVALPAGTETQWISWHGQVLEADCWFGPLATPGVSRSALVIGVDGAHLLTNAGAGAAVGDAAEGSSVPTGPLGDHLYEPDGAVIRAGLLGVLAAQLGNGAGASASASASALTIDPTIAYLTTDTRVSTPFAHGYAVRDVMPFGMKRLSSYLREHRIGRLEIKKRGTAVEPEELRRRLRPKRFGDESATLILTRIAGEQSVIVATPHRELGA